MERQVELEEEVNPVTAALGESTQTRASEVIRQLGGIVVTRPAIRDKRYRQGV